MTFTMTPKIEEAFNTFADQYDHHSNEYLDMDVTQFFQAGYEARDKEVINLLFLLSQARVQLGIAKWTEVCPNLMRGINEVLGEPNSGNDKSISVAL